METKRIKLDDLHPNQGQVPGLPTNPRQWTKKEIDRIAKSLQETPELFELRPIIVYQHNGEYIILGGNLRFEGCKRNKEKDAPCFVVPSDTPIDKLKEIVIKDNGSFGEWDYDALANEWDDLPLAEWGVPAWGTSECNGPSSGDVSEDNFDESEVKRTVCRPGDLWQLGEHRLLCGDSTSIDDVSRLMGGNKADLWVTDPPYNVNYAEKEQYKEELGITVSHHEVAIANDNMSDKEFLEFLVKVCSAAKENLKPGASFYIWHADSEGYNFRKALRDAGEMKLAETLIWVKDHLCIGRQDYHWQHEPCLYGWKEGAGHKWYSDRKQSTTLNFAKPRKSDLHPTMKPVELFAYLIENSSREGDVILDSFGGSGTTIIAAEQMNRSAYVMELEPHYCDVIIARWEKLTGREAVRI